MERRLNLSPPRPIRADDNFSGFDSRSPILDRWLKERALRNEGLASRTYVVNDNRRVAAFYTLAVGSVERSAAPGSLRRNMPDALPVMILGRLAVDKAFQKIGIGRALIRDAMLRTLKASEIAGIRAMLVHALDIDAAAFYRQCGFLLSPGDPLRLFFPLAALHMSN